MHENAARQLFGGRPTRPRSYRPRSEPHAVSPCQRKRLTSPYLAHLEATKCMGLRLVNCFDSSSGSAFASPQLTEPQETCGMEQNPGMGST